VREVVDTDDAAALVEACRRSQEVSSRLVKSSRAASSPQLRGRLITVFSPKGGTGKTMLATNLAVAFAKQQFRTCLIDLDLQFGDVAIALRLEPTRTTVDALGLRDAIDEHALTSLLLPYRTNLSVLPGPTRPADAEFITADLVTTLLDGLLAMHDVVIVDTPPAFNDTVLRALDMSDVHLLITTPDLASLKSVRVALDIGLTQGDIRDILHMPITARIPAHRDVVLALNHGTTVVESNPRSPVSRSITRIAQDLSTVLGTPAGTTEETRGVEVAVG
jgi:pilus assembly protein CpaE